LEKTRKTFRRSDDRKATQLRPVKIQRGFTRSCAGSVLIECGGTIVLCTASFEEGVPKWKSGEGTGWVTAEYDMLPGSTAQRRPRNRNRVDGRTQEIQRLIGRSLRAVIDFKALGENTIVLDCDVLQADGGTRTASVTGAYVALVDAVREGMRRGLVTRDPIRGPVAAVSVGVVEGSVLLDLCYEEDVTADVDCNVVMTSRGRFIEVQGTGEGAVFSKDELDRMLAVAGGGIRELMAMQKSALAKRVK
jgi:ribonuclease PH